MGLVQNKPPQFRLVIMLPIKTKAGVTLNPIYFILIYFLTSKSPWVHENWWFDPPFPAALSKRFHAGSVPRCSIRATKLSRGKVAMAPRANGEALQSHRGNAQIASERHWLGKLNGEFMAPGLDVMVLERQMVVSQKLMGTWRWVRFHRQVNEVWQWYCVSSKAILTQ